MKEREKNKRKVKENERKNELMKTNSAPPHNDTSIQTFYYYQCYFTWVHMFDRCVSFKQQN